MEFVSSPGKIDSVYSGAALCEPNSRLSAYVSARELEPVEMFQRLIDKGCTVEMAHQLALAYYQRGTVGGVDDVRDLEQISDATSSSRSVRSERFFTRCDDWLLRPGYCYTAMVRPSRRAAVAQMVGEFPSLDRMMRIPEGDMAWRKLSDIWILQVAPITMHMQLHESVGSMKFLNQVAILVKKFPMLVSQKWRDIVADVTPDEDCYIGMATMFGVKTKGGDTLLDFSEFAKLVPTSEVHNPISVQIDNSIDGAKDLNEIVHVGDETELKVQDDVFVVYRFEETRVIWVTPRVVVETDHDMSYSSDDRNIWLFVTGDFRCKISGAKGLLRLGKCEDYGVTSRFRKFTEVSRIVVDAAVASIGVRPDVTVVSSDDMHRLGIRGVVTTLDTVAFLTVGDVSKHVWETEEVARAMSGSMELRRVAAQVSLVPWEQFPTVMTVVRKLSDTENQLTLLRSTYCHSTGRVQDAVVTSRLDYSDYTGTVVVTHEGHVVAARREFPKAIISTWRQVQTVTLDSMLLRLFRSDRSKALSKVIHMAFPLCENILIVAPYKVDM